YETTINVEWKAAGYAITTEAVGNGTILVATGEDYSKHADYKAVAEAYGESAEKAAKDDGVWFKPIADKGYAVKEITVSRPTGKDIITAVDNGDGYWSFVMPDHQVKIRVEYEAQSKKVFYDKAPAGGTLEVYADGDYIESETKVDCGANVTFKVKADEGYVLDSVKVTKKDGSVSVEVTNNSFTMPDYQVAIEAIFRKEVKSVDLSKKVEGSGEVQFKNDEGATVTKADEGQIIKVVAKPGNGCKVAKITAIDQYGNAVAMFGGEGENPIPDLFKVPAIPVKVTVTFEAVG
ncbi:MAG: hypothetical protein MJ135_02405, partial [Oscillospiraceae bacterium]|nr:hypothetical protein [Oscillospiraceae bacterium]